MLIRVHKHFVSKTNDDYCNNIYKYERYVYTRSNNIIVGGQSSTRTVSYYQSWI